MPLKTTVVGSWPKPDCLNIPDWFSEQGNFSSEELSGLTGMGGGYDPRSANTAREDENMEDNIKQAVKEVIDEQVALGIDVVTDGEMERNAYYIHVMNNIKGIDMDNLEKKVMRSGAYSTLVPAVREQLSLRDGPVCWREWKRAKDLTEGNVILKFTIPGPMTIFDGIVNMHYKDIDELHKDLVKCLNEEILALAGHGCKYIQIDEPVMMRYPDAALKYGLDNLARCFQGLPEDVTKVIHLCCGYPDKLDTDEYPKAPKTNYNLLAPKIDSLGFDEVSIEDAEARNDLSLLSLFKKTKVCF
jgi:5-methyltetrahydropteroyltriglutamate--homocysteine methyltransferase